jgi:hypothetical protein
MVFPKSFNSQGRFFEISQNKYKLLLEPLKRCSCCTETLFVGGFKRKDLFYLLYAFLKRSLYFFNTLMKIMRKICNFTKLVSLLNVSVIQILVTFEEFLVILKFTSRLGFNLNGFIITTKSYLSFFKILIINFLILLFCLEKFKYHI